MLRSAGEPAKRQIHLHLLDLAVEQRAHATHGTNDALAWMAFSARK
jgi:hypothetical protein